MDPAQPRDPGRDRLRGRPAGRVALAAVRRHGLSHHTGDVGGDVMPRRRDQTVLIRPC